MKKLPLLPHVWQKIGYALFFPFLILGIANVGWDFEISWLSVRMNIGSGSDKFNFAGVNLTDELAATGLMISMLLISFSKEKIEDEAIQFFRLASLQWAVLVNYLVLIVCTVALYGADYLLVMMYNMFTILLFFIIRFRFVLFQHSKTAA
jgi:hypothetical protein